MGIDTQTFQLGAAAKAAAVPPQTIKTWLHSGRVTGDFTGGRDETQSQRRSFPFHTVMELATAAALLDVGFQREVERAFAVAQMFAHTNSGHVDGITADRRPGYPFAEGQTLLCASPDKASIVNVQSGQDMMHEIRKRIGKPVALVIVDAEAVFDRVVRSLGFDPVDELDAAYGKEG